VVEIARVVRHLRHSGAGEAALDPGWQRLWTTGLALPAVDGGRPSLVVDSSSPDTPTKWCVRVHKTWVNGGEGARGCAVGSAPCLSETSRV
jgi:hypothetical protein